MFHSFPNNKFILKYGYPYFRCLESDFLILIQISSGMPSLPLIRWYFGFIFVWKVCLAFFRLPKVIPDSWSFYYSRKETLMQTCTRLQVFVLYHIVILTWFHLTKFFGEEKFSHFVFKKAASGIFLLQKIRQMRAGQSM